MADAPHTGSLRRPRAIRRKYSSTHDGGGDDPDQKSTAKNVFLFHRGRTDHHCGERRVWLTRFRREDHAISLRGRRTVVFGSRSQSVADFGGDLT
jgi:hypothetical protein